MNQKYNELIKVILFHAISIKENDIVMIQVDNLNQGFDFINALYNEISKNKAIPLLRVENSKITKSLIQNGNEQQWETYKNYMKEGFEKMDAYIRIDNSENLFELSDVDPEKLAKYRKITHELIKIRCSKKWTLLNYPSEANAAQAKMSTEEYEEFLLDACCADYEKMSKDMDKIKPIIENTDKVRIVEKDNDDNIIRELSFSIKGLPAIKCCGQFNIPDGEIFTAPVKDSVNGEIKFNTKTIYNGKEFSNIHLFFENGKIVKTNLDDNKEFTSILETDEGSRFLGEFALGTNEMIKKDVGDILFDEKIGGSIHFAIGCSYDDCDNSNKSGIHWDLVQLHKNQENNYEIYFDDKLISKNGIWNI